MKYIGAKFTIDETFNVTANPFSRNVTGDNITPDLTYYSISGTGVVYGSEEYAKRQAIIDAEIFNVVYYDPDVYPSHVNIMNDNDWYTGSDYLYASATFDGILGRELIEKTETSKRIKLYAPGEAYHKIQRTVQTTLPVDYDQLQVDDENANTSVHSTILSGSGGSYEYVVYDMFSSGYSSLVSFNLTSKYRPLKNGQLNVLCDQDFSITVHTEHTIIFGMSDSNYEIYKPVMDEWIDVYNVWFIDDDVPFINTMPKLIESSPDPNAVWVTAKQWYEKTWPGLPSHNGIDVWSDGTNFYYSSNNDQYVLDETTGTWSPKTWTGLTSFNGRYVWTDGTNIYYSNGYSQYVLDSSTSTWSSKSWTGFRNFYGSYVWKSGEGIFYSNASDQYVLNRSENKWVKKTWSGVSQPGGIYIWTDGVDTYYSKTTAQYVLNLSTSTWSVKRWTGLTNFYGQYIWSDGDDIYYSNGSGQYVLDKETYTWIPKTWPGLPSFNGQYVWSYDDSNMYYSYGSDQFELHYCVPYRLSYLDMNESENIGGKWLINNDIPYRISSAKLVQSQDYSDLWLTEVTSSKITDHWNDKEWSGFSPDQGRHIWSDGENTYYSHPDVGTYIFDRLTRTWSQKAWTGASELYGSDIWSDGENLYYSRSDTQLVFNSSTQDWETKTWSGNPPVAGAYVWTDGVNFYWSQGQNQYVLDKTSDRWRSKTWYGLTRFTGTYIWSDGENVYYSTLPASGNQWILDKSSSTWIQKTWEGPNIRGENIWEYDGIVYYSSGDFIQWVLDKNTSTWSRKTWTGSTDFYGQDVWVDKGNVYYSKSGKQYVLDNMDITSVPYRYDFTDLQESMAGPDMWFIDNDIPYRVQFPEFKASIPAADTWLISNDIPFRIEYPDLLKSASGPDSWLQDKGWDPRRPWPEHRSIIQKVQTIPNIPDVDWTKSMRQSFEFYTVDPNNWYDDQKLENIISCDLTHDLTSDKRGNASITVTESLPESYIRTYLVVAQAGYMHKICLGTYLYMTSSDSFDGMKHNITMTGYTPMVELEEKLPPLGFHIIGITNRKHSGDAPMVTDAIKDIVTTYTRCEIENRTVIQKPLLNDFVAGTNDNFLTVINNILNASSLQQYILTVDEWGTIIVKDKPVLEDAIPTYIYTDDNSSILLPSLDTNDDIYGIPNVVEVLYTGDKRLPAIRVIVKNEDPTSIVSIPARGREIAKRFTITNIAAPVNDYSEAAVRAQVTAQAERLLEAASTINKTISYSHGYCDVKVGDTVLINYERAGVTGIRAKVVSQRISCKPGCQVDEQAVYTKKLWNRGV